MSISMRKIVLLLAAIIAAVAAQAMAADAYYDIPVKKLPLEGKLPKYNNEKIDQQRKEQAQPYVSLDQEGEAYLDGGDFSPLKQISRMHLLVRVPAGKEVAGRLFVPNADLSGMVVLPFKIAASQAKPDAQKSFLEAKINWHENGIGRNLPGEAWFRHQIRLTEAELKPFQNSNIKDRNASNRNFRAGSSLEATFDLFTGGRAMSENLQLDRGLPTAKPNAKLVKIHSLPGITVADIDWKPLIKDAKPKLDPLASKIPFDQHAVFFPTFQAVLALADETGKHDTPVLRLAQPRSEDLGVVRRYERQLGLSTSTLARLLGPTLVKSVALTGSDVYFPTGTDVAILFESPQPAVLEKLLLGKIALTVGMKPQDGAGKLVYQGFSTENRSVSSYVARLDNMVIVTNSLAQLKRLAAVQAGSIKSLATLPEYIFFRTRYPLGDAAETGLAFLSDATIRRWCGPQWRIADSRRTRARAVLAELQASQLDVLVKKTVEPGPIYTDLPILDSGKIKLTAEGVVSSTYGSLEFMTPISEMPLKEVTKAEAAGYKNWRDGYQRNWRWGFDPIALRITLSQEKLAADMTIMPLIASTDYRDIIRLSEGATLEPTAGNPHDSLVQFILAINHDSPMFKSGENFAQMMAQNLTNPLAWIHNFVSIYVDDDPFWKDLAAVKEADLEKFLEKNISRLPVAVQAGVANPLKLAAFLTTIRAFSDQAAPGLVRWEVRKHQDHPYTCIISTAKSRSMIPTDMICYTTIDDVLTITPNEKLLQRVIDRALDQQNVAAKAAAKAWLGSNAALRADRRILEMVNTLGRSEYERQMQTQCWNNLPILNEWRRLYPDRDPVEVQEQIWNSLLVCPGGGKYVWNEKYQTMESTVYGNPGQPKPGPAAPPVLSDFSSADFGLTLENKGLRARVELQREKK